MDLDPAGRVLFIKYLKSFKSLVIVKWKLSIRIMNIFCGKLIYPNICKESNEKIEVISYSIGFFFLPVFCIFLHTVLLKPKDLIVLICYLNFFFQDEFVNFFAIMIDITIFPKIIQRWTDEKVLVLLFCCFSFWRARKEYYQLSSPCVKQIVLGNSVSFHFFYLFLFPNQ